MKRTGRIFNGLRRSTCEDHAKECLPIPGGQLHAPPALSGSRGSQTPSENWSLERAQCKGYTTHFCLFENREGCTAQFWAHKGRLQVPCLQCDSLFRQRIFYSTLFIARRCLELGSQEDGTDGETLGGKPPQLTSYRPISDAHPARRQENGTDRAELRAWTRIWGSHFQVPQLQLTHSHASRGPSQDRPSRLPRCHLSA